MRVVLQQVDLDTCLTGLLLGAGAAPAELADPAVTCIEAGGSGQTELNNFDHHDAAGSWPPACVQALRAAGAAGSPALERLVAYVAEVDLGRAPVRDWETDAAEGLSLSSVFSGMRLTVRDPREQFFAGLGVLRTVLEESIDPFGPMPPRPAWQVYADAHRRERTARRRLARPAGRARAGLGRPRPRHDHRLPAPRHRPRPGRDQTPGARTPVTTRPHIW